MPRSFLAEHCKRCAEAKALNRRIAPTAVARMTTPQTATAKASNVKGSGPSTAAATLELEKTLYVLLGCCERASADRESYAVEARENMDTIEGLRAAGIDDSDMRQPLQVLAETRALEANSAARHAASLEQLAKFMKEAGGTRAGSGASRTGSSDQTIKDPWSQARALLAANGLKPNGNPLPAAPLPLGFRSAAGPTKRNLASSSGTSGIRRGSGTGNLNNASVKSPMSRRAAPIEESEGLGHDAGVSNSAAGTVEDVPTSTAKTKDGRLRCPLCARGFVPDRLFEHQVICRKLNNKTQRPAFSAQAKRLKAYVLQVEKLRRAYCTL